MSKRTRPAPRRRTASGRARKSRRGGRNSGALVRADTANPSRLVDRILSAPNLVRVVPGLPPEVLHRVVQHHGLEECGELLVLATPDQLAHVFDRDLWHAAGAAPFDQFDAERFGVWIEVLVQADAIAAAAIVAGMDLDLMTTALAQHIRVFDHSAVVWYPTLDGEQASSTPFLDLDERFDVGGYVVLPKREGPQDAIAALLTALGERHRDYFSRLMSGCVRLSHSAPEIDGLDNLMSAGNQAMFDAADAREQRLGAQGYVATAQARVFLEMARRVDLRSGTACPPNAIAVEYLRDLVDPDLHAMRSAEQAFLANAILAGSVVQSRPFSSAEAAEAAAAACALGRQNWPARWSGGERDRIVEERALAQSDGVFVSQDLVSVFQVGWTILHEQVSMHTAECLLGALSTLHGDDVVQSSIDALRIALTKHWRSGTPWRAKEELEVIAIFDMVSWTALLGLLAEFPVLPAAVAASLDTGTREVSASAFEFISSNSQIAIVHRFLESLGDRLRA